MGSLFGKKSPTHNLPPELVDKAKNHPGDREVIQEIAQAFDGDWRSFLDFYRQLGRENPAHGVSVAQAYAAANKLSLAVIQYQKFLRANPNKDIASELAAVLRKIGKEEQADKVMEPYR